MCVYVLSHPNTYFLFDFAFAICKLFEQQDGKLVMPDSGSAILPILTAHVELTEDKVTLSPPLDPNQCAVSVQKQVSYWLTNFLSRGHLISMLSVKVSLNCSFDRYNV